MIQKLDLASYIPGDRENSEVDSAMYFSEEFICEMADGGPAEAYSCITHNGLYFGTSDEREPKFCPRHYFEHNGYRLEPTHLANKK